MRTTNSQGGLEVKEIAKPQTQEACFVRELEKFEHVARAMKDDLAKLDGWSSRLARRLEMEPAEARGLKQGSALTGQVEELRKRIAECVAGWARDRDSSAPMRRLSEAFGDKAVLLVFGKVNAGKSSFCNFLGERFRHHGERVQYFYLVADAIVDAPGPFVEAATEATARIQGVKLGEKLILLDTPGLHSVTKENGDLTKRFTDSADAVLWLTSSTSPGQVQELDALSAELKSRKPLVPVITKSDVTDEDEVDGAIVKVLRNKSAQNRALQESDVLERARTKLHQSEMDVELVRRPVSVSAHVVRSSGDPDAALDEAGFQRLYEELRATLKKAAKYKERKAVELTINHLERNVAGSLQKEIRPYLDTVKNTAHDAVQALDKNGPHIAARVVDEVLGELPGLLERHKQRRDAQAVYQELSALSRNAIDEHLARELEEYAGEINAALLAMSDGQYGGFDDVSEEYEETRGRWKKAAAAGAAGAAGAALGAVLGSILLPGLGTFAGVGVGEAVGGLLAGAASTFLGEKEGDYLVDTERKRVTVGVSYERLHAAIEQDLRKRLPSAVTAYVESCKALIELMMREVERVAQVVSASERELEALKEEIAHESV